MRHTLTAFSDAFRIAHPHAEGQFTFWSQRARARPINRGLRLDYFLLCEVSGRPPLHLPSMRSVVRGVFALAGTWCESSSADVGRPETWLSSVGSWLAPVLS